MRVGGWDKGSRGRMWGEKKSESDYLIKVASHPGSLVYACKHNYSCLGFKLLTTEWGEKQVPPVLACKIWMEPLPIIKFNSRLSPNSTVSSVQIQQSAQSNSPFAASGGASVLL